LPKQLLPPIFSPQGTWEMPQLTFPSQHENGTPSSAVISISPVGNSSKNLARVISTVLSSVY
jgi:hypothetical protein